MAPGTILLLAVLAVLVVVGARWSFAARPLPAPLRPLAETGVGFVLLGALLGPFGINVFTAELLSQLRPVLVIGLGWIGFLYGSHLEWRLLRRYPPGPYAAALTETLVVLIVVSGCSWLLLTYGLAAQLAPSERLAAALVLGVCAMGTAPAGAFLLTARARLSPDDINALRFFSAVDDLPALVLLGVMGAFLRPAVPGAVVLPHWLWLAFAVGIGVGLGYITHWLFPRGDDVRQNTLVLLGIVSLGAGAAAMLQLSPLFVTALAGCTFANLSERKEQAYGLLVESEHTLYTVFLLVAGLLFRFDWSPIYILVPAYLLLRLAGKLAGGYAARSLFMRGSGVSPLIGAGLLFQGGMALAIAVSFQRRHLAELDSQVTTTIVLGVVLFGLLSPAVGAAALRRRRRA